MPVGDLELQFMGLAPDRDKVEVLLAENAVGPPRAVLLNGMPLSRWTHVSITQDFEDIRGDDIILGRIEGVIRVTLEITNAEITLATTPEGLT